MVQDVGLELPDAGARVDPELVGQPPPQVAQRREGIGLPPALVERERQQPPGALPQRVRRGVRLQVVHRLDRRAQGEGSLRRVLDGHPVQLLEAGDLGSGPVLVGVPAVGTSAPQGERLGQPAAGARRVGRQHGQRGPDERLEVPRVDLLVGQPEGVAGGRTDQHGGRRPRRPVRLEGLAQVRDVGLQRSRGPGRRLAAPQVLRHPVGRHHRTARGQQDREDGTLARPAQVDRAAAEVRIAAAEHAHPQRGHRHER